MREIFFNTFGRFKNNSNIGNTIYSPVSTYEGNIVNSDNPYNTTTTAKDPMMLNGNFQANGNEQSLSAVAVFEKILLNGPLTKNRNKQKCVLITMFIGLTAISLGALLIAFSPYDIIFKMKATFSEGGEMFEMWRKPPVQVYLKVYLFNVTNREAFLKGKEKLKVQQVGPYVYRERMEHTNVTFNANGTITASPRAPLEWIPELNTGSEDDVLILPNVALLSFANVMADASFITRAGVNMLIRQTNSQPLVEQTAKEFMFGYKSTLVTLGNKLLPSWIMFEKLGLIDRMYDFEGDVSTTYTGETDIRKTGLFASYNNLEYLPQWEAPCNRVIDSSDATKFPTYITPNDTLWFFRKSLCRAVPMVRTGITESIHGIPTERYKFKEDALDNGESNPNNKCFCRNGECLPRGLLDVTQCYYGFPIALSYPHFHLADPRLREEVEGSYPDPNLHETYFDINLETGIPARLSVKMQINMALKDISSMTNTEQFSNMVIPLLWTDIEMPTLPKNLLLEFFILLRVAPFIQNVILYLLLICGISFITLSICALIFIPQSADMNNVKDTWPEDELKYRESNLQVFKISSTNTDHTDKDLDLVFSSIVTSKIENTDNNHRIP